MGHFAEFPVFYAQSHYDPKHLDQIVGFSCTNAFHSLSECPKGDRQKIQDYSHKVKSSVKDLVESREGNGVWSISCVIHQILGSKYGDSRYAVPMGHDMAALAVQKWVNGQKVVLMDEKDWPSNANCAHKLLSSLSIE